jgi:hypothetical protein
MVTRPAWRRSRGTPQSATFGAMRSEFDLPEGWTLAAKDERIRAWPALVEEWLFSRPAALPCTGSMLI